MAGMSPACARINSAHVTSFMSCGVIVLNIAWRSAALCRANGLPGPPGLPGANWPRGERSLVERPSEGMGVGMRVLRKGEIGYTYTLYHLPCELGKGNRAACGR